MHTGPEKTGTWCLYVPEFSEVYTSDAAGVIGAEECRSVFRDRYAGRVPEDQYRIERVRPVEPTRYRILLLLPNLRGEWTARDDAVEALASLSGTPELDACVVQRGSKQERDLLAQRRRRLRDD